MVKVEVELEFEFVGQSGCRSASAAEFFQLLPLRLLQLNTKVFRVNVAHTLRQAA